MQSFRYIDLCRYWKYFFRIFAVNMVPNVNSDYLLEGDLKVFYVRISLTSVFGNDSVCVCMCMHFPIQ